MIERDGGAVDSGRACSAPQSTQIPDTGRHTRSTETATGGPMKTRFALVGLAGLLGAACASVSPGGPSLVADVAVATHTAGARVVYLWGPGEHPPHAAACSFAGKQAGGGVRRNATQ